MHALEDRLGDAESIPEAEHDAMLHRYSDLQDRFRVHDGYSIELKTATVLQGWASDQRLQRPTETFSGGWQMRIALANCCSVNPSCSSTSRPTTSTSSAQLARGVLNAYPYAVILVSHDRFPRRRRRASPTSRCGR
jgi:ATP-binding cassette subfamily F protein 3